MPIIRYGHFSRWLLLTVGLLILSACSNQQVKQKKPTPFIAQMPNSSPVQSDADVSLDDAQTESSDVLFQAFNLVGTPYQWGGEDPSTGFDCSGLVAYVYGRAVDLTLPRSSHQMAQIDAPKIRNKTNLKSGDLLFFNTNGRGISHVAIYIGNGRFIHAPNSRSKVRTDKLSNPYWNQHFLFAKRPLDE